MGDVKSRFQPASAPSHFTPSPQPSLAKGLGSSQAFRGLQSPCILLFLAPTPSPCGPLACLEPIFETLWLLSDPVGLGVAVYATPRTPSSHTWARGLTPVVAPSEGIDSFSPPTL